MRSLGGDHAAAHGPTGRTYVATPPAALPADAIAKLVMGDALEGIVAAGQRSRDEPRVLMIHAVCDRP